MKVKNFNSSYLIRLDDACPTMDSAKWDAIERILDAHSIKPIVAIIPANANPLFQLQEADPSFWEKARRWQQKGWGMGLHGFDHVDLVPAKRNLLSPHPSEFAGMPLEVQKTKIRKGWDICVENGITPTVWVAPWHTFDQNTLIALKTETSIRTISDGIAWQEFSEDGFRWVPVQLWGHVPFPWGTFTVCLHPANMSDDQLKRLDAKLGQYKEKYTSLNSLPENERQRKMLDKAFHCAHKCIAFLSWFKNCVL